MRGALAVAALAVLVALPAGQTAETGSVTGHIKLTRVRGTPLPSNVYQPRGVNRHAPPPLTEISNVVLYLKGPAYSGTPHAPREVIRQADESVVPRVVAITRGSTVEFPNGDPY